MTNVMHKHEMERHPWRHRFRFRENVPINPSSPSTSNRAESKQRRRKKYSGREKRPDCSSVQLNANPFSLFVSLLLLWFLVSQADHRIYSVYIRRWCSCKNQFPFLSFVLCFRIEMMWLLSLESTFSGFDVDFVFSLVPNRILFFLVFFFFLIWFWIEVYSSIWGVFVENWMCFLWFIRVMIDGWII